MTPLTIVILPGGGSTGIDEVGMPVHQSGAESDFLITHKSPRKQREVLPSSLVLQLVKVKVSKTQLSAPTTKQKKNNKSQINR